MYYILYTPIDRRTMFFKALHPLAQGDEILQSYVPIAWEYEERQEYLKDMFGFTCQCIRCTLDLMYSTMTEEEQAYGGHTMQGRAKQVYNEIQMFLEKYICISDGCTGILTPMGVFTEHIEHNWYECNVCGYRRTHADFLDSLERAEEEEDA